MIFCVKNNANFTLINLKTLMYLGLPHTHTHTHTHRITGLQQYLYLLQFGGFAKIILNICPRLKSFRRGSINKSETYGRNKPKETKNRSR